MRAGVFLLASVLIALVDFVAKNDVRTHNMPFVCNHGIAFGIPLSAWIIPFLFFAFIFTFIRIRWKQSSPLLLDPFFFPFVLMVIGAGANLFDRLFFDCITDYMKIGDIIHFNGADLLIVGGAIMIVARLLRTQKKGRDNS